MYIVCVQCALYCTLYYDVPYRASIHFRRQPSIEHMYNIYGHVHCMYIVCVHVHLHCICMYRVVHLVILEGNASRITQNRDPLVLSISQPPSIEHMNYIYICSCALYVCMYIYSVYVCTCLLYTSDAADE